MDQINMPPDNTEALKVSPYISERQPTFLSNYFADFLFGKAVTDTQIAHFIV